MEIGDDMETVLIILILFAINMIIGAIVWVCIDDGNQSLYKWYKQAPIPIITQPLILTFWIFGVYFKIKRRRYVRRTENRR